MRVAEFSEHDSSVQSRAKSVICALRTMYDTLRLGMLWNMGAWVSGHRFRQINESGSLVLRCDTCGLIDRTVLRETDER